MPVCRNYIRVAWASTGIKEGVFTRLRCKQWSCDACAEKNAQIWQIFLKNRLPEVSDVWWLVTLTANENTRSSISSLENIRLNSDTLLKRFRRVWPTLEYVRTYERHPTSFAIHGHFIMANLTPFVERRKNRNGTISSIPLMERSKIKGTWSLRTFVKKTARECGMGYIADARRIVGDTDDAVHYVTKYLTKAQQDLHVKGLRHVQTSAGIGSPEAPGELIWETGSYMTPYAFPPGSTVRDLNTGFLIDNNYWEVKGYYPSED